MIKHHKKYEQQRLNVNQLKKKEKRSANFLKIWKNNGKEAERKRHFIFPELSNTAPFIINIFINKILLLLFFIKID